MALEVSFSANDRTAVAILDLSGISSRLVLSKLSHQDRLGIVNNEGRYIICSDPARVFKGEKVPVEALVGKTIEMSQDNERFYVSSLQVSAADWRSVYLRSKEVADAPIKAFLSLILALSAVCILLSLLCSLIAWRSVTQPLGALAARIESIAAGRYSERVSVTVAKEYEGIVRSFNSMAESIERRDREIQRNEERYRLLFSGNRAPALLIDASDGSIRDAKPSSREILRILGRRVLQVTDQRHRRIEYRRNAGKIPVRRGK